MDIIGHSRIVNFLTQSRKKNKLAQAYLFVGPEHVGKFTVAYKLAQEIIGFSAEKNSSDLIIIRPEVEEKKGIIYKRDIKIAVIKKLEKDLALTSSGKGYKVAIIDEANRLNINAQNALLKTLEEPNKRCILILVCHDITKILLTIQSRCLIKKFNLVQDQEIFQILANDQNQKELVFWSLGRPGIAQKLKSDPQELKKRQLIQSRFKNLLAEGINERFIQAEELSKNKEEMKEELNLWIVLLRKVVLGQDEFLNIAPEKAILLIDEISEVLKTIQETNVNTRLILEKLFLNF